MTNCIFYTLFFILFINVSFGSLRMSQVNRTFMSMYKGMLEASVVTIDDNGEPIYPYYEKSFITSYVSSYLNKNISKYTKDYTLTLTFYKDDGVTVSTSTDKSRCVKFNLKANINYLFKYDKSQTYSIKSRENLWIQNY